MNNLSIDNRHKWAVPYWANPRLVMAKAADDDGGGDDDDDDGTEDDDEDDDEDLSDLTVEQLRAQLKVTQNAVKTANDRSARRRSLLKSEREQRAELEKKLAEKPTPKPATDPAAAGAKAEEVDVKAIERDVEARVQAAADERVKRAEVRSELKGLIAPEKLDRALKLIDFSDLSINKRGDVDGIDEAIEELKADMPELFVKATKRRRSVAGRDEEAPTARGVRERPNAPKGQSTSERQAAMLLGR